jgi:hypothetical protein
MTGGYMALRCCERYGIRPFGAGDDPSCWNGLTEEQQRMLLTQESIRLQEEHRERFPARAED